MTYSIHVWRQEGRFERFDGSDAELESLGDFVLEDHGRQAVTQRQPDGRWQAYERVPEDLTQPFGDARRGKYLGDAVRDATFSHVWGAYQRVDGSADSIAGRPSPNGTESLGAAVRELLRLA